MHGLIERGGEGRGGMMVDYSREIKRANNSTF